MTRSHVNVDVFWLPFHEQRGRLVATRRVRTPGMDVTEFWSSDLVEAVGLVGITTVRSTHEWTGWSATNVCRYSRGPCR